MSKLNNSCYSAKLPRWKVPNRIPLPPPSLKVKARRPAMSCKAPIATWPKAKTPRSAGSSRTNPCSVPPTPSTSSAPSPTAMSSRCSAACASWGSTDARGLVAERSGGADCGPCPGAGVEAELWPRPPRGTRWRRPWEVQLYAAMDWLLVGRRDGEALWPKDTLETGAPTSPRWSGGALLPAGSARPFPRRQARQAPDRVRAVVRPGPSGGGGSL